MVCGCAMFNLFAFMLSESILSMDIGSTGPTSLRSNFTDETDATNEAYDGPEEEITIDLPEEKSSAAVK